MPTLDAIGVVATDMTKTLAFYRLVGLEFPAGAEGEGHVEAQLAGGVRVMFDSVDVVQSFSDYEPPTGGGYRIGFAFRCDSPAEVDASHARVVEAGYASKVEPFDALWGQRYATVLDPDGNPVDFYAALE